MEEFQKRLASAKFDFNDFMSQFERLNNMGGLKMLKLMPGFNQVRVLLCGGVSKRQCACEWRAGMGWGDTEPLTGAVSAAAHGMDILAACVSIQCAGRCALCADARALPLSPQVSEKQLYEVEKKVKMYTGLIASMTNEVGGERGCPNRLLQLHASTAWLPAPCCQWQRLQLPAIATHGQNAHSFYSQHTTGA